jgi:hypothetical protein
MKPLGGVDLLGWVGRRGKGREGERERQKRALAQSCCASTAFALPQFSLRFCESQSSLCVAWFLPVPHQICLVRTVGEVRVSTTCGRATWRAGAFTEYSNPKNTECQCARQPEGYEIDGPAPAPPTPYPLPNDCGWATVHVVTSHMPHKKSYSGVQLKTQWWARLPTTSYQQCALHSICEPPCAPNEGGFDKAEA